MNSKYQKNIESLNELIIDYKSKKINQRKYLIFLAKLFNIPIDKERIKDYVISSIDISYPRVEVIDQKTNTKYQANYTLKADLLNIISEEKLYNSVISINPKQKIEKLYYIGGKTPIITKRTYNVDNINITIEQEKKHKLKNNNQKITISVIKKDRNGNEINLLTRSLETHYKKKQLISTQEKLQIHKKIQEDKYISIEDNQLVYEINELIDKKTGNYIYGICLEDAKAKPKHQYQMYIDYYPFLKENISSAIILRGKSKNNLEHQLEIYKNGVINIHYQINKEYDKNNCHKRKIKEYNQIFSEEKPGTITNKEIQDIIDYLKQINNPFLLLSIKELNNFNKKLNRNKINKLVDTNKEEYSSILSNNKKVKQLKRVNR